MAKKPKGLSRNVKTTTNKQKGIRRLMAKPEAGLKRHVSPRLAPPPKASTYGAVPQGQGPLADTTDTVDVRSESAVAELASGISHGKNELDLQSGEIPSVARYASEIKVNWQRGVETFMNVARLCADANSRLSDAKKQELMTSLPFGQATFSKFAKFGADTRLTPEIQRLLPPRYTTIYAVSLLTNEEFDQAIAKKIVHPDLKREELAQWRRTQKKLSEEARSSERAAPNITAASEIVENDDASLPAQPEPTLQSEPPPIETNTRSPDAVPRVASPAIALPGDTEIIAAAERDSLSPEDQRAFDALNTAWGAASELVRERFRERIGATTGACHE